MLCVAHYCTNDCVLLRLHVQVWYDDPVSSSMKYNRTLDLGMTVIGMWVAGATGFDEQATTAMWAAIPTPPKMHTDNHAAHNSSGGRVQLDPTETAAVKSDDSGSLQLELSPPSQIGHHADEAAWESTRRTLKADTPEYGEHQLGQLKDLSQTIPYFGQTVTVVEAEGGDIILSHHACFCTENHVEIHYRQGRLKMTQPAWMARWWRQRTSRRWAAPAGIAMGMSVFKCRCSSERAK